MSETKPIVQHAQGSRQDIQATEGTILFDKDTKTINLGVKNSSGDIEWVEYSKNLSEEDIPIETGIIGIQLRNAENIVQGNYSSAVGYGTKTTNEAEFACGKYNTSYNNQVFSVGAGQSDSARWNVFEVYRGGQAYCGDYAGRYRIITENNINDFFQDWTTKAIRTTIRELYGMKQNSTLVPGQWYLIVDFITETCQEGTSSANHQFDILVMATSNNTLSEEAKAVLHAGDNYFSKYGANLNAWKIWFRLDDADYQYEWFTYMGRNSQGCYIMPELLEANGITFTTPVSLLYAVGKLYIGNWDMSDDLIYEVGNGHEVGFSEDLVLFKSDVSIYPEEGVDYNDLLAYRGTDTLDGVEYDKWEKFERDEDVGTWFSRECYILTERIVANPEDYNPGFRPGIYRMIDEYGNDCPYDFYNILFGNRYTFTWVDVDSEVHNAALIQKELFSDDGVNFGVTNNVIIRVDTYWAKIIPENVFISTYSDDNGVFYGITNNHLFNSYSNEFMEWTNNNILITCHNNYFEYSSNNMFTMVVSSHIVAYLSKIHNCVNIELDNIRCCEITNCDNLSCEGITELYNVSLEDVHNFVINDASVKGKKIKTNSKGEVKIYNEADLIA